MALNGPKYEQSAVDIISPMLTITQRLENQNKSNRDMLLEGTKGLAGGLAETAAMKKRSDMLDYKGDEYVKTLRTTVEELKAELVKINNELEQLKKADQITSDVPDVKEAETTSVSGSDALGRYASNQMNGYGPSEIDVSAEFSVSPEIRNKYKIGSKALGGF